MELLVLRSPSTLESTDGTLYVDGQPFGYTLEDVVRRVKIPKKTAIPAGRYQIIVDYSPHFGRFMPHVINVPGFTGIRLHSGNTAADTEGCIMVGWEYGRDFIGTSWNAFTQLFEQIYEAVMANERVYITIKDA